MTRLEIAVRLTEALLAQDHLVNKLKEATAKQLKEFDETINGPTHDANGLPCVSSRIPLYAWRLAGDLINLAVHEDGKPKP